MIFHQVYLEINFDKIINMEILKDLWAFLSIRKKLWLLPIIIVMMLFGGLLIIAQGSVIAPFLYTIF